jgi:hypothetical protein
MRVSLQAFGVTAIIAGLVGCRPEGSGPPPPADFLVAAGDSTFWIHSDSGRTTVRRSSMLLARFDDRFHEIYVVDDDRSYFDAVMVGQRIFRRDLVTGDSVLLFEDSTIAAMARAYARRRPNELPLAPDEDASEDPETMATTETELLDAFGALLTVERHVDIDIATSRGVHSTFRRVIDMRSRRPLLLPELVDDTVASRVFAAAARLLQEARDSVRRARSDVGRRAAEALSGFVFDSTSFAIVDDRGRPAVAFLVPGRGARAGGYALPLPPITITPGQWWNETRSERPSVVDSSGTDVWRDQRYDVVASYDSQGEQATLAIAASRKTWALTRLPAPVRRVHRLDSSGIDLATRKAVARAFDESALYSGEGRTTFAPLKRPTVVPVLRPSRADRD